MCNAPMNLYHCYPPSTSLEAPDTRRNVHECVVITYNSPAEAAGIMDASEYEIEILDRPGLTLSPEESAALQARLRRFGSLTFDPLPEYQLFETSTNAALDDKIIALARKGGDLVGFLSAVVLPISGIEAPVVHTGLTVIHPDHRKTELKINLFGAVFFHLLALYPGGVWLSTLSRILTSLGQVATYTIDVFPSPAWNRKHPSGRPTETHLHVAREISARHRDKMLVPHGAHFDEAAFVFRAPAYRFSGPGTVDGVNDPSYRHRDAELADFYAGLLQGPGDEVLQISYLDPVYTAHLKRERDRLTKARTGFPVSRQKL